jgi:hypothetical protein
MPLRPLARFRRDQAILALYSPIDNISTITRGVICRTLFGDKNVIAIDAVAC